MVVFLRVIIPNIQISGVKIIFFRNKALKNCHEEIDFQTDYVMDLAKEANYGHDLDVTQIFYDWEADKVYF